MPRQDSTFVPFEVASLPPPVPGLMDGTLAVPRSEAEDILFNEIAYGSTPALRAVLAHHGTEDMLYNALAYGSAPALRALLARHGAQPDGRGAESFAMSGGVTPLMAALKADNAEYVSILLEAGADPDLAPSGRKSNCQGETPAFYAAKMGQVSDAPSQEYADALTHTTLLLVVLSF